MCKNYCSVNWISLCPKMKLKLNLRVYTKFNSITINISVKLLKDSPHNQKLSSVFLGITPSILSTKKNKHNR